MMELGRQLVCYIQILRCWFNVFQTKMCLGEQLTVVSLAGSTEKICIFQSGVRVLSCLGHSKVNISCLFPAL